MTAKVQGSFAAGFEPVKEALEKLLNSGCEDKVQLCVYVGKDCVLDLHQGKYWTAMYCSVIINIFPIWDLMHSNILQ